MSFTGWTARNNCANNHTCCFIARKIHSGTCTLSDI